MREAKLAASVFGVITACLIGGGAVAYNAAPQVSTRDNFEIVEPAYNGMTLTAETSEENKTAITEPAKEKTETIKKSAQGVYNRPHAVNLSYIASTADTATAAAIVATTFQSVTETEPQTTTQAATAAPTTTYATKAYTTENNDYQWTTTEPTTVYTEPETVVTTTEEVIETETEPETVTEPPTEAPTEEYSEPDTEPATEDVIVTVPDSPASGLPISESDFILLCNVVAHEAGSHWIGSYEKAYVAEVVMNRVYSPLYPNTVYGVLTQPYQFSGSGAYVNLGTYSGYVTESVKEAVRLYFTEPDSFTQGYMSFYGDGIRNYFR